MQETAIILANNCFQTSFAKTAHGLVRGPSRYRIVGVVDPSCAGQDAGELLDGKWRGIPIFAGSAVALLELDRPPGYCIIGVATSGGGLPADLRRDLIEAASAGISLVNGLHQLLGDDPELALITDRQGSRIIDIRRPRPTAELRFWSGEICQLSTPRLALLGTDCALGKRTTCALLCQACQEAGIRAAMVYTGQTGWLQGYRHGFILDSTPNDFVCGELEAAILDCQAEDDPEIILIEGQSALRNPAGPCGSELILAGGAQGVILQHAPGREFFDDLEDIAWPIPPIGEEISLIRLLGAEVWAVTLTETGLSRSQAEQAREHLARELGLPVVLPLSDGVSELVTIVSERLAGREVG